MTRFEASLSSTNGTPWNKRVVPVKANVIPNTHHAFDRLAGVVGALLLD